jgi:hypothetical protein
VTPERPHYRFGPLERRGLIAGWRGGQIASVAGGLAIAVLVLRARPTVATVLVAVVSVAGGVALACWPVGGRTGEEWLPTVVRWGSSGLSGTRRHRSPAPLVGQCVGPDGLPCAANAQSDRPGGSRPARGGVFGGLNVLGIPTGPGGITGGVLHDPRTRTYTAVLALRGHSFALLGSDDKARQVAGWAGVLSSLARERSVVHRVQWIASALPDDGQAVRGYLSRRAVLPEDSPGRRSYDSLVAGAGATTCRHEVLLAVQVRAGGSSARAVRAAGGGDAGACAVLLREVATLRRLLGDADVVVERTLGPRALASVIRRSGEPRPAAVRSRWEAAEDGLGWEGGTDLGETPVEDHALAPARAGDGRCIGPRCPPCAVGVPWPMAVDVEWGCLRTDGTWHATYWIAEWPRVDVGPDFLGPLLLGPVRRSLAVVMEPLSPSRAVRQVEQARTADLADSELRRRGGFLSTARRAREEALVHRREEELADGHASFRFSGYVTVTAPTRELLIGACEATEQAAGQCRLELRRLYGDQERAFTCTLPLGRGLA